MTDSLRWFGVECARGALHSAAVESGIVASNYFGTDPGLDVEKATNGVDADTPTGPVLAVGDTVTWTYVTRA